MSQGSPRQIRRKQTPRHPAAISQTSPSKTQVDFTPHQASATETQQSQCTTVKGIKESNVSLESGYASQTSLIVKEQNVSCSELGGSTINSRLAVLELEVDCLKAKSVKSEEETTMIKKKPRLGKNKKAFSGGDIHGVTTEAELLGNYSSISSLRTERNDSMKQVPTSSVNVEYVREDLTKEELTTIAHKLNPTKGSLPSSGLHKNVRVWDTAISISPVKK